ncbi:MAG: PD-(D/E)XK nuclease family protein [Minisyncoccota bacterium]
MGKNLKDINPDLPAGIISTQEGWLTSAPVAGAEDCYIKGRYDILIPTEDGSQIVVDFKITNPDEEQIRKYSSQLHAYKYALENPAEGKEPVKVSKMGLISVTPESIEHIDGKFVFTAVPKWHPIEEDMGSFLNLIKEISNVLNGELPPPSETCSFCKYRKQFEPKEATPTDVPF